VLFSVCYAILAQQKQTNKRVMKVKYTAVHCRVPNEIYDRANELLDVTQKSMANLVSNALTVYVDMVVKGYESAETYKPLKLDKYAYTLHDNDKSKSIEK